MTMSGMRFMQWMHLAAVIALASCASPPPAPRSLEGVAEGYARVALQLAQHDPSLVEAWRGDAAWRPGRRVPVAALRARVEELRAQLGQLPAANADARHTYLASQLRALHFASRRLMGEAAGIDEQAIEEFGVAFSRVDPARIAGIHAELEQYLAGPGPLADRLEQLRSTVIVPAGRTPAVMAAALAACREAASVVLPLPQAERVTVTFTAGLGWDGYARYRGAQHTEIEINADGALDLLRALRLACHEGYPGHHVQHLLIAGLSWPELELSPGFGPHLLFAEGAAEVGAELAISPRERVELLRRHLMPTAGLSAGFAGLMTHVDTLLPDLLPVVTDVARQYVGGTLPREQALARLRNEALLSNPEGALAMIERRRARALVYGEGRRLILERLSSRDLSSLHALFRRAIALQ